MQAIFLILAIAGLAVGIFWFLRTSPAALARQVRIMAVIALSLLAILSLLRGGVGLALTFAALAAGLMLRAPWPHRRSAAPQTPGSKPMGKRISQVQTEYLEMELDLDSGAIRGRVLKGVFTGRNITSMAPAELALLWQDCRMADSQSAQIIETYLDHIHPSWREDLARAESEVGPGGKITVDEAYDILGLKPGAPESDVRQAHRELMKKMHPDRGGSSYLAAKINEAKELILQSRKSKKL